MNTRDYPRTVAGQTVWACCLSTISAGRCGHAHPAEIPGTWGFVTVAVRDDGTRELRPAYVDDSGHVVYSPGFATAWRDAPTIIGNTWRTHHGPDGWRPWEWPAGTVIVDGPTFHATKLTRGGE